MAIHSRLIALTMSLVSYLLMTNSIVAQLPPPPAPTAPSIDTYSLTTTTMPVQPGVVVIKATYVRAPAANNIIKGEVYVFNTVNGAKVSVQVASISSGPSGPNGTLPTLQTGNLSMYGKQGVYAVFTLTDATGTVLDTKTTGDYGVP